MDKYYTDIYLPSFCMLQISFTSWIESMYSVSKLQVRNAHACFLSAIMELIPVFNPITCSQLLFDDTRDHPK